MLPPFHRHDEARVHSRVFDLRCHRQTIIRSIRIRRRCSSSLKIFMCTHKMNMQFNLNSVMVFFLMILLLTSTFLINPETIIQL